MLGTRLDAVCCAGGARLRAGDAADGLRGVCRGAAMDSGDDFDFGRDSSLDFGEYDSEDGAHEYDSEDGDQYDSEDGDQYDSDSYTFFR